MTYVNARRGRLLHKRGWLRSIILGIRLTVASTLSARQVGALDARLTQHCPQGWRYPFDARAMGRHDDTSRKADAYGCRQHCQFEREFVRERTNDGRVRAKAKGIEFDRKPTLCGRPAADRSFVWRPRGSKGFRPRTFCSALALWWWYLTGRSREAAKTSTGPSCNTWLRPCLSLLAKLAESRIAKR